MSEQLATQYAVGVAALAKDRRFAPRSSELETLAKELSTPEGDAWAGLDLFAAFPPDSSIELKHRTFVEAFAGVLAAVSVFLPVGWTWMEFRRATTAYEQMIVDKGEPEGRTFLGLWATGFDGRLDPSDHLAPMTLVSLMLIGFAISCIVVHRLVASRNVRSEERQLHVARADLIKQLTGAQLVLNSRRADHPLRIEGILKSSMDKLRKTQDAARKAVVELSETAANVNTGVSEVLASVQSARAETETLLVQAKATNEALETATARAGESIATSVAALDGVVRTGVEVTQAAVSSSVSAIDSSVTTGIKASQESVRAAADQVTDQLGRAMTQFEHNLAGHLDGLTAETVAAIGRSGAALANVVDRIGGSTEVSAAAAGSLAEQVAVMREDNALASDQLRVALEEVRSTLESIEIALSQHGSTLQGHVSELTGTRDAAERMLRHLTSSLATVNGGLHGDLRS